MHADGPSSGWEFVAEREGAAMLLDAFLRLDGDESYTKTELAEAADVPLKRLYLSDSLEDMVRFGVLESVESRDGEDTYSINEDSDILIAAATFDESFRDQL
jgi:hypothetical protein